MSKQERTKKSSPLNKIASNRAKSSDIKPWIELDELQQKVFEAVVASREVDTWSDLDRMTATMLAQVQTEWQEQFNLLQEEGAVVYSDKGYPDSNKRIQVVAQLFGQFTKQCTALGLTASQRGISGHKQAKRNAQDIQAANRNKRDINDDGTPVLSLLARPDQ